MMLSYINRTLHCERGGRSVGAESVRHFAGVVAAVDIPNFLDGKLVDVVAAFDTVASALGQLSAVAQPAASGSGSTDRFGFEDDATVQRRGLVHRLANDLRLRSARLLHLDRRGRQRREAASSRVDGDLKRAFIRGELSSSIIDGRNKSANVPLGIRIRACG